mmetsp:Transcript_23702/g.33203  ORF Transcript_23702/g.33203 Transcript_23702/m.33203 type:complete len:102 (-) Transcript_23702:1377-1682(-)
MVDFSQQVLFTSVAFVPKHVPLQSLEGVKQHLLPESLDCFPQQVPEQSSVALLPLQTPQPSTVPKRDGTHVELISQETEVVLTPPQKVFEDCDEVVWIDVQ